MVFECVGNYSDIRAGKFKWGIFQVNYVAAPRKKHGIVLVTNGNISFENGNSTFEAAAGDLVFVPKGARYSANMRNADNYLVNFENDSIKANDPVKLISNADRKYCEYFNEAIEMQIKSESELLLKSRFYRFLDLINKETDGVRGESSLMKKAKKLLDDDECPTISDVARKCAVSESGLRTRFKDAYGLSPMEYKMKVKINKAKFLLESTSLSANEISDKLGFYDPSYFSKSFKKHVGCSPSDYMKGKLWN